MTLSDPIEIITRSPEETVVLGRALGKRLRNGATLCFYGDLGSGKTAMIRGLAQGLDVPPEFAVTSPSYTLVNAYPGRLTLYHVDLYRLGPDADLEDIGLYDMFNDESVVAIEWAEYLTDTPEAPLVAIRFEILGDLERRVWVEAAGVDLASLSIT